MSLVQLHRSIYGKFTVQYTAFIIEHIQAPREKVILGGVSSPIIYLLHKSEKSLIFLPFYCSWTPFAHPILEFHSSVTGLRMRKRALRWPCWCGDWHWGFPRCSRAEHQSPVVRDYHTTAGFPSYWRIQMEISAPASFSVPSQVVFQLLLSDLSVSVASRGGNVQEQKSRWRLSSKWGDSSVCGGSRFLWMRTLAGAGTSYLLRCCFCWGVACLKRHAGIWLCSCLSRWKRCY